MICLAVHRNDELVCMAGIADASLLTSIVAGGVGNDEPASFHVAGMQDLPMDRSAHVYWIHETPLFLGDCLRYTLAQSDEPSSPIAIKATDSPEYLREQREFEEIEKSYVAPVHPAPQRWPALEMRLKLKDNGLIRARLLLGQEHIMCSMQWDKWRAERCRVYVRSFTGFSQGTQQRTTEWLRGVLNLGESFEISVHA